jgi:hypothetical protein
MTYTITLELPEDVYEPLSEEAKRGGKATEELAAEWLTIRLRQITDDPLRKFIGAFDSGVTDLGTRHHEYLGEGLLSEMRQEDSGDR